jgi:hypothetical protein
MNKVCSTCNEEKPYTIDYFGNRKNMKELTNIVAQNLDEITILEQEFPYLVSIFDEQNNPIDNLDWFALEIDAIDHAKNNPGSAVFYELYNKEKEICEYTLLWHPNAEVVDYVYDSFMYEDEDIKDDQQRIEWKLTIDGYEDLNQHDKNLDVSNKRQVLILFVLYNGITIPTYNKKNCNISK